MYIPCYTICICRTKGIDLILNGLRGLWKRMRSLLPISGYIHSPTITRYKRQPISG